MVYAAAVAATLFYAANVPLCFAFFVRAEGGVRVGLGLRLYVYLLALARARAGEMPKPSPGKSAVRLPAKFWFFAALELLRRIEGRARARAAGHGRRGFHRAAVRRAARDFFLPGPGGHRTDV